MSFASSVRWWKAFPDAGAAKIEPELSLNPTVSITQRVDFHRPTECPYTSGPDPLDASGPSMKICGSCGMCLETGRRCDRSLNDPPHRAAIRRVPSEAVASGSSFDSLASMIFWDAAAEESFLLRETHFEITTGPPHSRLRTGPVFPSGKPGCRTRLARRPALQRPAPAGMLNPRRV